MVTQDAQFVLAGQQQGSAVGLAEELSRVFARMSGLLLSQETVATSLRLITTLAHDTIRPSTGSGVTLIDDQGRRSAAATSRSAVQDVDALQYELNEGPCLSAWETRTLIRIDETAKEARWPRWCAAVQRLGVKSVLSYPLVAGDQALGAMKVYSEQPSAFGADAERRIGMFAPQAAVLLANMQSHEAASTLSEELKAALVSRDVIATAKGILMAREGISQEEAFARLLAVSQRDATSVRDVAQALLSTTVVRRR